MSTPSTQTDEVITKLVELAPVVNKSVSAITPDTINLIASTASQSGVTVTADNVSSVLALIKTTTDPDAVSKEELILRNPIAQEILKQGLEIAGANQLNPKSIVDLSVKLMQKVETESTKQKSSKTTSVISSGSGKKNMVICVVKLIIKVAITDDAQEKLLLTYVDNYLPTVIDVVVSISNGEFSLNDFTESVSGCLPFGNKK